MDDDAGLKFGIVALGAVGESWGEKTSYDVWNRTPRTPELVKADFHSLKQAKMFVEGYLRQNEGVELLILERRNTVHVAAIFNEKRPFAGMVVMDLYGTWVVNPRDHRRGIIDHVYEDNKNEQGRLVQVDYGMHKENHREFTLKPSADQESKWADKFFEEAK